MQTKFLTFFSERFPFLCVFFDSSKHAGLPLQLMYSAPTMSRCRAAVRGCAAAVRGGEEGAEASVTAAFFSCWKFRKKTCKKILKIVLLAYLILNAVKTPYSQFTQSLPRMSAVKQPSLYFSNCDTGILEALLFALSLWEYFIPIGCSMYYTECKISIFFTHIQR